MTEIIETAHKILAVLDPEKRIESTAALEIAATLFAATYGIEALKDSGSRSTSLKSA